MGKVLWHVTMSLDGFLVGPNDSMDWVFGYAPNRSDSSATRGILEEVIRSNGLVLCVGLWSGKRFGSLAHHSDVA